VDVDGQLGPLTGLGETVESAECLLKVGNGVAIGAPRHRPERCPAEVGNRLLPQFPVQGVVGQPLGLLGNALGRKLLDRLGNADVQITPPVLQHSLVGHLVSQRVLESVFDIGKEPNLVEELGGLQAGQLGAHPVLRRVGNGKQQRQGYVLTDDGSSLEQALGLGGQAVDARGQDGLHGGVNCQALGRPLSR
jgi:hypothetical protein